MSTKIIVEASARHIHVTQETLEELFGKGHTLTIKKELSQPGQYACDEKVTAIGPRGKIERISILGPVRPVNQLEVSLTDAIGSGVTIPVKLSGELIGTSPVVITGPAGQVSLSEGLIVAKRHIHCATTEAAKLGLKNGAMATVRVESVRPTVFENVAVRVEDDYKFCLHLDTDEGNAAGINKIGQGILLTK